MSRISNDHIVTLITGRAIPSSLDRVAEGDLVWRSGFTPSNRFDFLRGASSIERIETRMSCQSKRMGSGDVELFECTWYPLDLLSEPSSNGDDKKKKFAEIEQLVSKKIDIDRRSSNIGKQNNCG